MYILLQSTLVHTTKYFCTNVVNVLLQSTLVQQSIFVLMQYTFTWPESIHFFSTSLSQCSRHQHRCIWVQCPWNLMALWSPRMPSTHLSNIILEGFKTYNTIEFRPARMRAARPTCKRVLSTCIHFEGLFRRRGSTPLHWRLGWSIRGRF